MMPGEEKKITNSDEQEVAINQSSADEGGYDEPGNHASSSSSDREDLDKGATKNKSSEKKSYDAN